MSSGSAVRKVNCWTTLSRPIVVVNEDRRGARHDVERVEGADGEVVGGGVGVEEVEVGDAGLAGGGLEEVALVVVAAVAGVAVRIRAAVASVVAVFFAAAAALKR